ncbi:MAG: alpha/beta hydrolase [Verrucomicrobiales bacterium]|nr:alpha/beta hydrolase [Verrucomicrobiales bacterium]
MRLGGLILAAATALTPLANQAAEPGTGGEWVAGSTVLLWPEGAPGALGTEDRDRPTLTLYPAAAAQAVGTAVVICPGGGYGGLASHEGKDYALWLNTLGVHGAVLKYRLGSHGYRHPRMLEDAARAVRWVRAQASDWGVRTNRIGIMGSSAGGHLASTLLTHHDGGRPDAADPLERWSSRPDFGVLCYPVITLGEFTHQGSRKNLLGEPADPGLVAGLSNELQVRGDTPPTFLWHTVEDGGVPVENSLQFAAALRRAGVPFALHLYERGRHGIGLANGHPWTRELAFWMEGRGYLSR